MIAGLDTMTEAAARLERLERLETGRGGRPGRGDGREGEGAEDAVAHLARTSPRLFVAFGELGRAQRRDPRAVLRWLRGEAVEGVGLRLSTKGGPA